RTGAYLDSLGWTLYRRGKVKEGLVWLDRAIRMIPYEQRSLTREDRLLRDLEDPVLYDHLADALYRDGQRDRAAECWKKARVLLDAKNKQDDNREIKKLRTSLETKLKQLAADETVEIAPQLPPTTSQPDAVLGAR